MVFWAVLLTWAAMFSLGMVYQSSRPYNPITWEVPTTGGGIMLVVPKDYSVVPVLNEHSRPYMRPTDQEG
jgi:hypothetical protein